MSHSNINGVRERREGKTKGGGGDGNREIALMQTLGLEVNEVCDIHSCCFF